VAVLHSKSGGHNKRMSWLEQLRTTNWGEMSLSAIGAYLLGCFATGYYLVRAVKGTDIRTVGSGSVGARNVSRVLGRTGFILTTLGDALKGALAIWAARHFFQDERLATTTLLAVVAGHIWPVQLRFHGGKGVATSIGALLIYDWRLVVVYVAVFAYGLLITRKTILPGLFAFVCLPAAGLWLQYDGFELAALALLAGFIVFAHRTNLLQEFPALAARRGTTPKTERTEP
jgi:glycerol-3-phosphate acyltransferase PlsY